MKSLLEFLTKIYLATTTALPTLVPDSTSQNNYNGFATENKVPNRFVPVNLCASDTT